jgi:hypothetical protein
MDSRQFVRVNDSTSLEIYIRLDAISRVDISDNGDVTVFFGGDEGLVLDASRSNQLIDWLRSNTTHLRE